MTALLELLELLVSVQPASRAASAFLPQVQGLVAQWTFNEGSGETIIDSAQGAKVRISSVGRSLTRSLTRSLSLTHSRAHSLTLLPSLLVIFQPPPAGDNPTVVRPFSRVSCCMACINNVIHEY